MTNRAANRQLKVVAFEKLQPVRRDAGSPPTGGDECLRVYQRELDYLLASLRRLGVAGRDLEDVVHEVFLVMHRRWEDYDRLRPPRPWLFGIAYRVSLAHRRKSTREALTDAPEPEDSAPGPEDAFAQDQARRLLLRALGQIPIERRAVLVMHEVDEVPMREVASHFGIPLFTAYSRLRKARSELDAALARLQRGSRT